MLKYFKNNLRIINTFDRLFISAIDDLNLPIKDKIDSPVKVVSSDSIVGETMSENLKRREISFEFIKVS